MLNSEIPDPSPRTRRNEVEPSKRVGELRQRWERAKVRIYDNARTYSY